MATYEYIGGETVDGMVFGKAASDKVALHGATPCIQASAITACVTTGALSTSAFGFSTAAQADAITANVNSIITALKNKGILA
jgi:hypothetical protein